MVNNTNWLDTLYKACRQLGYSEDVNSTNIRAHMSPNLKLLYCRVNKCASTMTLELLKQLFSCDTECLIKNAERVRLNTNARQLMDDAFSFMVVREPYGRLFSTYCNIFYFPKEDWLYRGIKLIKLTRLNISYDSLTYGHDLSFSELVKYTVDTYENNDRLDEHVRPMHHKSCNPCVFKFDYIAHLETLQNDFDFIFNNLQEETVGMYQKDILISLKQWTTLGPIKHLFRTIPLLKDSNISLYDVYLRAWCYYQITGHVLKTINFPYNETNLNDIKKEDFLSELTKAMNVSAVYKDKLKLQRAEAMLQAYSTISDDYMERLSNVVLGDCLLFGYENKPAHLFDKTSCLQKKSKFDYFKGL
ncbi:carbohydrate sulfotransferase 11-like [Ruditapes philippinarum]|uniref:carbohydrate sulfotransferase 11-like n=1 Tax=Ruditapes philippinarum TaxID=129788 RepID=UPI00295B86E9|nr:carbohydrate sulfotransferase 11-like [Ruditapes philippinarum]